ncbi:hypothetical protein GGI02_001850 [Coemansia sp. RSA 2322]|nr:hypothetical protein GGI02_001850 [Coemansia sp. RSA 2322]
MIIGYGSTRDTLSLYGAGSGGVGEMALSVPDETAFGFLMFEGSRVLVTHVSHKISGVQRARGLAHQKTVTDFFDQHDVTVNTSKPSELTPTMLREKTRHLAIKSAPMKAAGLGRSDSFQPSKLKPTIWHQRSQASSRASTPSESSLGAGSPELSPAAAASHGAAALAELMSGDRSDSSGTCSPNLDAANTADLNRNKEIGAAATSWHEGSCAYQASTVPAHSYCFSVRPAPLGWAADHRVPVFPRLSSA